MNTRYRSFSSVSVVDVFLPAGLLAGVLALSGCGADDARTTPGGSNAGGTSSGNGGNSSNGNGVGGLPLLDDEGSGGSVSQRPPAKIEETLPAGFTAELQGGWRVLGPLADFNEPSENVCANVLRVVARDFTTAHLDFGQEKPASWTADGLQGHYVDLVLATLGDDRKPVINPSRTPSDVIEHFSDWYVNTESVNVPYVMDLWLEPLEGQPGTFVFDSDSFFPLDAHNTSPGDVQNGGNDGGPHNFLFTTELHTSFEYKGGEVFTFRGDDDVWAFINGKLAVDLGGIHGPIEGSVDLDGRAAEFGIEVGNVYTLDLFQAERNPGGSNYRIETSLDFRECGILKSDIVR